MPLSLTEDVKTVSEVKQNLRAVLAQIRDTGRPVVVTWRFQLHRPRYQ